MAAYHKVEVSLNTNAVEVGIPSPQSVTVTVPTVGPAGPQGPAGPKGDPGDVSGSIAWDNVTDKPSTFTPSSHTHVAADITDFTAAVEAVSPPADWDTLANKPASFTPSAHSSSHHTGGTDALAAHQINGQTIFSTGGPTYSSDQTLAAARALQITVSNTNASGINLTLPIQSAGTLNGDTYVIIGGSTVSGPITIRRINVLSPLIYETLATITATGQQYRFRSSGAQTGGWSLVPVDTHTHAASAITSGTLDIARIPTGTSSSTVCIGNDARLSDSRTPTSHASSHASAGSDPVTLDPSQVVSVNGFGNVWGGGESLTDVFANAGNLFYLNQEDVAAASHAHGNLTSDGKLGSVSGLPVVTTTAGAVTTLALGTAGQVLTVNSGANGVEFAAASGGVSAVNSTLADILSVSGSDLVADDLGADKLYGWDDSESKAIGFTIGSGLSVSGDTLSATASGGSKTYAVFTATDNQPPATNFMTLDTRNGIAVLDADDTTDESAVFVSIIPEGASLGSGLKIRLHWMATTATSGNVVWDVSLERMTTDLDSDSFDTIASGTAAANGTSGILTVTEITLTTIDSVTAGDGFRLKVTRDANNASDTMTGDAELVLAEVRSAA